MQNPTSPFTCSLIIISFSFFTFHFSFTTAQTINTFAGTGTGSYNGDGIQATTADIYNPSGVYVDAFGNLFFADQSNNRIREVNTSGTITTVAGVGVGSFSGDGGQATAAEISSPQGVFIDRYGNLFFTDFFNNRVREVNTSGVIKTIAGNGFTNFSGDGGRCNRFCRQYIYSR
jgi:trimeric autotransporter adhesin